MGTKEVIQGTLIAPQFSGDRECVPMNERERDLDEAIQWVKCELSSLKSQNKSLMRQFLALRSQINHIKEELPSISCISVSDYPSSSQSPKENNDIGDDDIFFNNDQTTRERLTSETSSLAEKTYSSGSEDEKF